MHSVHDRVIVGSMSELEQKMKIEKMKKKGKMKIEKMKKKWKNEKNETMKKMKNEENVVNVETISKEKGKMKK